MLRWDLTCQPQGPRPWLSPGFVLPCYMSEERSDLPATPVPTPLGTLFCFYSAGSHLWAPIIPSANALGVGPAHVLSKH